jgi:hypothetical protein
MLSASWLLLLLYDSYFLSKFLIEKFFRSADIKIIIIRLTLLARNNDSFITFDFKNIVLNLPASGSFDVANMLFD